MNEDTKSLPGNDEQARKPVPHEEEDGRNREWEDRARVNLEETPAGVHTSVERDFEPENLEEDDEKKKKETPPPY